MKVSKYKFGSNLVYEVEELNLDTFKILAEDLSSPGMVIKADESDLEYICKGYEKLMIGFGNINKPKELINLFDLHLKESKSIIVYSCTNLFELENVLAYIRQINKDINIISCMKMDAESDDFNLRIYCPINGLHN